MDNLGFGLMLMVVGMVTVFIILLIVINLGKLLIAAVNKFAPDETQPKVSAQRAIGDSDSIAAIKAAVQVLTAGKGKVVKIEKL
jgi:oxaloacetate decarboxylase gamma subunit